MTTKRATWRDWIVLAAIVGAVIMGLQIFAGAQVSKTRFPKASSGGGASNTSTTQTGAYTATTSDYEIYQLGNNAIQRLPTTPPDGTQFRFRNAGAPSYPGPMIHNWLRNPSGSSVDGTNTNTGQAVPLFGDYASLDLRYDATGATWRMQNNLQSAFNISSFQNTNRTALVLLSPGVDANGGNYGGGLEMDDAEAPNEVPWPKSLLEIDTYGASATYFAVLGNGWSTARGVDSNDVGIRVGKNINGMGAGLWVGNTNLTGDTGLHLGNTAYGSNGPKVFLEGWTTANQRFTFTYPPAALLGTAIASAATIAPQKDTTHVTGTTTISTITPPPSTDFTAAGKTGCVKLIADGAWATATGGNIALASAARAVGSTLIECYDAGDSLWHPVM